MPSLILTNVVEITDEDVAERSGTSSRTGREYHLREQSAYLHTGKKFPTEFQLVLPDDVPGGCYPIGFYELSGSSFRAGSFGGIDFRPVLGGRLNLRRDEHDQVIGTMEPEQSRQRETGRVRRRVPHLLQRHGCRLCSLVNQLCFRFAGGRWLGVSLGVSFFCRRAWSLVPRPHYSLHWDRGMFFRSARSLSGFAVLRCVVAAHRGISSRLVRVFQRVLARERRSLKAMKIVKRFLAGLFASAFMLAAATAGATIPAPTSQGLVAGLGSNTTGSETGVYEVVALVNAGVAVIISIVLLIVGFMLVVRWIRRAGGAA